MLFWVSSYMTLWSNILFNLAVVINLIVAFFYPFINNLPSMGKSNKIINIFLYKNKNLIFFFSELNSHFSGIIWTVMLSSGAMTLLLTQESAAIRPLVVSTIIRLIFSIGPEPTLYLLGTLTV